MVCLVRELALIGVVSRGEAHDALRKMPVVLYTSRQQAPQITYEQVSNDKSIFSNLNLEMFRKEDLTILSCGCWSRELRAGYLHVIGEPDNWAR